MSIAALLPPHRSLMKRFPPNDHGVLLPVGNREAAALGVCMYTASAPRMLAVQRAAYWAVRLGGTRLLPGAAEPFTLPGDRDTWELLLKHWAQTVGPVDDLAVYRRRQLHRTGLTMIAVRGRTPVAVLKVRDRVESLEREQQALSALERLAPHTFSAPRPMGHGVAGPWCWSAQEVVFRRPHRPVLAVPPPFFDEVSAALAGLLPATGDRVPAHGDLTPWNLRRDHRGRVWLFDWEDWGLAPVDADRAYFSACSRAVGGPPIPNDLAPGAVEHHRPIIESRRRNAAPGVTLPNQILAAFDEVEGR